MRPASPMRHETQRRLPMALVTASFLAMASLFGASGALGTEASPPDESAVSQRVEQGSRRLQRNRQFQEQLRQALAGLAQPTAEDLRQLADQNRALQNRLTVLETALKGFAATNSLGSNSVPELERQLTQAEHARDQLVQQQTEQLTVGTGTNHSRGWRNLVKRSDLTAIPVVLVKNRVVPKMQPFYEARSGYVKDALSGKNIDVVQICRVHDGEAAANAIKPGGLLDSLLAKADPKKNCVMLLVCADSVAAYHSVAQFVAKRGFAHTWDTAKDEDSIIATEQLKKAASAKSEIEVFNPTAP